jgi:hypothetical protein
MKLEELAEYCKKQIRQRPDLKDDIAELYVIARDETEDGGSESSECEGACEDIKKLIEMGA